VSAHPGEDRRAAFEQLFRDTRSDLLAYLLRRSRSAEDAADLLAEIYLIAWQKLDAIPTGERARLWSFGVARNLLLQGASRRRSGDLLVERLAGELRSREAAKPPPDDERVAILRHALAALPERDREILTLAAWEGLKPKQIAAVTGSSANVVRVRLHRIRTRLQQQLSPTGTANRPPQQSSSCATAGSGSVADAEGPPSPTELSPSLRS
jgi:RNA polymerase sigma factor (sigma-70 family)